MYVPDCCVWEITRGCNMRCIHCGASAGPKRSKELTTEEALKVCEDLNDIGTKEVSLIGGEVFVRRDWFQIAKKIRSLGMRLVIITNGLLVDDNVIKQLKELKLRRLGVSLDGSASETHDYIRGTKGSFNQLMELTDKLSKEGISASFITTLTRYNIYDLFNIAEIVVAKKANWQIQVASCHGTRMTRKDLLTPLEFYFAGLCLAEIQKRYASKEFLIVGAHDMGYYSCRIPLLQRAKKPWNGCPSGMTALGIQSDGDVRGCLSLYDDKFKEGNVLETPLSVLWNDPKKFKINRYFKKEDLKGYCKKCNFGEICQAGCKDMAFNSSGSPYNNLNCFHRIEAVNAKK